MQKKFEICNCVKIHVFSEYIFMLPLQILYVKYKGQEVWLTWKLRKTVSRLKNTAMEKKPNMRRGFLPIRSITKPWRKDSIINNRVLYIIFGCRVNFLQFIDLGSTCQWLAVRLTVTNEQAVSKSAHFITCILIF